MKSSSTTPHEELQRMRKEYSNQPLDETDIPSEGPLVLFRQWLDTACETSGVIEPNAMCLATVGENGRPDNRNVLLKSFDENGFVWFTNFQSKKGADLAANPFSSLCFWWCPLERSVRV